MGRMFALVAAVFAAGMVFATQPEARIAEIAAMLPAEPCADGAPGADRAKWTPLAATHQGRHVMRAATARLNAATVYKAFGEAEKSIPLFEKARETHHAYRQGEHRICARGEDSGPRADCVWGVRGAVDVAGGLRGRGRGGACGFERDALYAVKSELF